MPESATYTDFLSRKSQCDDKPTDLERRVQDAIHFCRRHEHPGVNLGVHDFAAKVRKILEGKA